MKNIATEDAVNQRSVGRRRLGTKFPENGGTCGFGRCGAVGCGAFRRRRRIRRRGDPVIANDGYMEKIEGREQGDFG
jgi:hypothetical protein